MGAEPIRIHDLVPDPTAGDESGSSIRALQKAQRDEERVLLRRKLDGVVAFLAGPANVAMQLGWPEVGYGVVESRVESGRSDLHPFKRFRTTIGFLGVAMLGTHEQRLAYREAINSQHRQVRSTADSPVKYNAFNRDLQLWVASCLYYGSLDAITRMHGPLSSDEELVLLRAGARFGTTLQVSPDQWHQSPDEFWSYWEEGLARVQIDDRVGDYLRGLLKVDLLPGPLARVFGPLNQWLNTGFIPEPIRDQLGLTWSEQDERRHARLLGVLGVVSRRLPHVVRAFPINAMMWNLDIRRRLGKPMV